MTPLHTRTKHCTLNAPTMIGLCGHASSGKDTVAQLLQSHLHFRQIAFADALRFEVAKAFGVDESLLTDRYTKEQHSPAFALERCADAAFVGTMAKALALPSAYLSASNSPRQIMQWWGTEYRRATDRSYWTQRVVRQVNYQCKNHNIRHVISDVRFENEAQAVRNMGGQIWQVIRPGQRHESGHASATDGTEFAPEVIINNSHTIKHLQALVLGAWLMQTANITAEDITVMGLAHTDQACAEWAAAHSVKHQLVERAGYFDPIDHYTPGAIDLADVGRPA